MTMKTGETGDTAVLNETVETVETAVLIEAGKTWWRHGRQQC